MVRERVQSTADSAGDIDTPFIDLTICPAYDAAYKDDVLQHYGMDKNEYRNEGVYFPRNNAKDMDLRVIFQSITYDIAELLSHITIFTASKHNTHLDIEFDRPNFTDHINITTKYWPGFGRCFSIHPKEHILKQGVNAVLFVARIDIYIYFGYPGQFMNPNTKSKVGQCLNN